MISSKLEHHISELDQRVLSLEKKVGVQRSYPKFNFQALLGLCSSLTLEIFIHVVGWIFLTISTLGLLDSWSSGQVYNPYLALLFFISIWLIVRCSSYSQLSDSTLKLDLQSRSKALVRTEHVHFPPQISNKPRDVNEFILSIIRDILVIVGSLIISFSFMGVVVKYVHYPALQSLLFVLVIAAAGIYYHFRKSYSLLYLCLISVYLLLLLGNSPLFSVLAFTLIMAIVLYGAVSKRKWTLLLLLLILSYTTLARWTYLLVSPAYLTRALPAEITSLALAIATSLLVSLILFSMPFIWRRRLSEEREIVRGILIANSLAFTALSLWLLSHGTLSGWFLTNFLLLFISMIFGYLAWVYSGRYSYVKYFFSIGLVAFLFIILAQPDHTIINIVWFMVSVLLISSGFLVNSYSLRVIGLGVLAVAISYYFTYIMVNLLENPSAQGIIEASLLGSVLVAFLLMVGNWYENIKTRGVELQYQNVIIQACGTASLFILFAWIQFTQDGGVQSFLWICLGILAVMCTKIPKYSFLSTLGIVLIVMGIIKFVTVDAAQFTDAYRFSTLIGFAALLLWCSYLLWRYPKKIIEYFKTTI